MPSPNLSDEATRTSPTLDRSRSNLAEAARKSHLLRQIVLYSFVAGVAAEIWESLAPLFGIPLLVMFVMWCVADAREQGRPIGRVWGMLLILAFVMAFPADVFRTHGWAGFKVLLKSIAFFGIVRFGLSIAPLIQFYVNR